MNMVLCCKDCGWRTEPNEFTSYCPECQLRGERKTLRFIEFSDAGFELVNRVLKASGVEPLTIPQAAPPAPLRRAVKE